MLIFCLILGYLLCSWLVPGELLVDFHWFLMNPGHSTFSHMSWSYICGDSLKVFFFMRGTSGLYL